MEEVLMEKQDKVHKCIVFIAIALATQLRLATTKYGFPLNQKNNGASNFLVGCIRRIQN